MGMLNILTIVFIALKLMGYIDWSWWLVLMPTIVNVLLVLYVVVVVAMGKYPPTKIRR